MNGKVITAVVVVTLAATSSYAAVQLPTQFSEKQLEKRAKKLAKLSPQHFAETATVQDDDLETIATITTSDGFIWRGGFTSRVKADNFLRAFVDKKSGEALWQLYQTVNYNVDWRRFTSVNVKFPQGLERRDIDIISRDVVSCAYGTCAYRETIAFSLEEEELRSLLSSTTDPKTAFFRFKFNAQNSLDWTDDISLMEIQGALMAVDNYRQEKGLD